VYKIYYIALLIKLAIPRTKEYQAGTATGLITKNFQGKKGHYKNLNIQQLKI
jgi:hypothetical protein